MFVKLHAQQRAVSEPPLRLICERHTRIAALDCLGGHLQEEIYAEEAEDGVGGPAG